MCVAGSQKSIQACSVLPPPPGALGADSLGEPGDSARLPVVVPPVANAVGSWGERGAMTGACGAGWAICDGGAGDAEALGGGCGGATLKVAPLKDNADRPETGVAGAGDGSGERPGGILSELAPWPR